MLGGTEVRRSLDEVGGSGPEKRPGMCPLVRHSKIKDLQRVAPQALPATLTRPPL